MLVMQKFLDSARRRVLLAVLAGAFGGCWGAPCDGGCPAGQRCLPAEQEPGDSLFTVRYECVEVKQKFVHLTVDEPDGGADAAESGEQPRGKASE